MQKQQLSNHLLECLRTYCRESDCLSVDVRDLEPDIYCKG